ncbi:monooxygenase [Acinetobacter defluvii]|uniref:Monooxygenase n=1 Tax=Acinetobacter defluvii TaxID=1871111 RepID=A0A2S2FF54_9GAMM|nr:monooxygenase [Acinetobacter defluvii]AWL28952.1 monooxygenase [Acinetobacter defluvii]
MPVLLQVDFPTQGPFSDEMSIAFKELAESINLEKGFLWKIWTENSQSQEAGGIYLFDNEENAQNYAKMHTLRLQSFGIKNIRTKCFSVNFPLSKINQANFLVKK